jgi:hypothetical protein
VRHGRPLRFMAHHTNCFAPLRESADSITRKAYYTGLDVIIARGDKIAALYVFLDSTPS